MDDLGAVQSTSLVLWQSTDIHDYRLIFEGFVSDFGYVYYHAILAWCDIIEGKDNKFWQVWLISFDGQTVGFCGLYSLYAGRTDELWLAWFGILPAWRNRGIGTQVLRGLQDKARIVGCTKLCSYVDVGGKPLPFYCRNGFKVVGTVRDFLTNEGDGNIGVGDFEDEKDWVIEKFL